MEIWGIQINIGYFAVATLVGGVTSGLLFWLHHKSYAQYRISPYKLVICFLGITFAVYHILNVVLGGVRTGWP